MDLNLLATNIKRLRRGRLTQAGLAQAAGLSLPAVKKLESGKSAPRPGTLQAIADALDVHPCDLFAPVREWRTLRFRSKKRMKNRDGVLYDLDRWLDGFNMVEEIMGGTVPFRLAGLANSAASLSPETVAELCRVRLGLKPDEPVLDICGLLEGAGIKVFAMQDAPDSFFGLSIGEPDGGPAMVVRTGGNVSVERQIFSAAHELGHLLLHPASYKTEELQENDTEEKEADRFAGHFLMPDTAFRKKWQDFAGLGMVQRVLKVKSHFRVSYGTVLFRLVEDGIKGKGVYQAFSAAYQRQYGGNLQGFREPEPLEPSCFCATRLGRLTCGAVAQGEISVGRGAEILKIDILEMRERLHDAMTVQ